MASIAHKCKVNGCIDIPKTTGYCNRHYISLRRHGDPLHVGVLRKEQILVCTLNGCDRKHKGRGYCGMHLIRLRKYGDTGSVEPVFNRDGKRSNSLYSTYQSMKQRCYDKGCKSYKDYGGRGITVCERWLGKDGFNNFAKDMGDKPTREHSIDRINPNGNYDPTNCRWADRVMQSRNRRYVCKNSSGVRGVCWVTSKKKWSARISNNGKTINLGCFSELSMAIDARRRAEELYDY